MGARTPGPRARAPASQSVNLLPGIHVFTWQSDEHCGDKPGIPG